MIKRLFKKIKRLFKKIKALYAGDPSIKLRKKPQISETAPKPPIIDIKVKKLARWLQISATKSKKYTASAQAKSFEQAKDYLKDLQLPLLIRRRELYRQLRRESNNPIDRAIYLRLFRKVRNLINERG
jgi:hypothetical protein